MNTEFPKIITQERKKRKLSQKQAAADLGISQALLSHYEKGIRECGLDFVVKIADYYGVSCDRLLGRSEEQGAPCETEDAERIYKTASFLLSACMSAGGEELEKDMLSCIMMHFYKLFRMLGKDGSEKSFFTIPGIPAENLADSVIMNICASIKLKSSRLNEKENCKISPDTCFLELIETSESKISELLTAI